MQEHARYIASAAILSCATNIYDGVLNYNSIDFEKHFQRRLAFCKEQYYAMVDELRVAKGKGGPIWSPDIHQ